MSTPLALDATSTVIVVVCALSFVGLVLIVVAPWSKVRREQPLDPEVEARLLLGEDPKEIDRELEARRAEHAPVAELHPDDPSR